MEDSEVKVDGDGDDIEARDPAGAIVENKAIGQSSLIEEIKTDFNPGLPLKLAFASICVITLAAALDTTSLSVALPIITERLHGTAIQAFWSGTSFLVTSAVFQPVIGGLSHIFG